MEWRSTRALTILTRFHRYFWIEVAEDGTVVLSLAREQRVGPGYQVCIMMKCFAAPPAGHCSLHAWGSELWSGCEYCRELNVPPPPVLTYFSHHIDSDMDLFKTSVEVPFANSWLISLIIRCEDLQYWCTRRCFPLSGRSVRLVDGIGFMSLFDDSSLISAHVPLVFALLQADI